MCDALAMTGWHNKLSLMYYIEKKVLWRINVIVGLKKEI